MDNELIELLENISYSLAALAANRPNMDGAYLMNIVNDISEYIDKKRRPKP